VRHPLLASCDLKCCFNQYASENEGVLQVANVQARVGTRVQENRRLPCSFLERYVAHFSSLRKALSKSKSKIESPAQNHKKESEIGQEWPPSPKNGLK